MAGGSNYRIFAPEVWSDYIKVYFKAKLYAANVFRNYTGDLLAQGGDTITLPNLTEGPDANSLTTTTGDITDMIVPETRTQLTVNSWKNASRKFADFEVSRIKTNYGLQQRYLKEDIGPKLAKTFDSTLIGTNGETSNYNLHTGTSVVSITNTAITEALRIAESYSMPIEEMVFFVHPNTYWRQVFRQSQFIDASQLGKNTIAVEAGVSRPLGYLYGKPVYVSNQVGVSTGLSQEGYPATTQRNAFVHPRSIAYAYGRLTPDGPRLREMDVANAYAMRVTADIMYGTAIPGKDEGIKIWNVV